MKIKLTSLFIAFAALFQLQARAQETNEAPLDTLTRHVSTIRSELDVLKRIKISGYMQPQFQVADSGGISTYAGGNFANGTDKRFQLRRARVKFQYDSPADERAISTTQFVFQIDVTQNGLTIKDMYGKFTDPWTGWFSITAGMQNRPFGYEIGYSSSLRESPERGRMSQIIFPNERDLGAMITIQGPKMSNWNWLVIQGGFFNGTGGPSAGANTSDFDKFKDFIGQIKATRSTRDEKIKWGLGASYYDGGFRHDVSNTYKCETDPIGVKGFKLDIPKTEVKTNINARTRVTRNYVGMDGQFSIDWMAGITTIRAEYIQGKQPGTSSTSTSPAAQFNDSPVTTYTTTATSISNSELVYVYDSTGTTVIDTNVTTTTTTTATTKAATATAASDIYIRNFSGAYFYFLQNIGRTPLQAIVKYDWYDPNTDVEGDEIGKAVNQSAFKATNGTDIRYTTLGLGLAWRWDANVKITAYYDLVQNETSTNQTGFTTTSTGTTYDSTKDYTKDLKDNVFTLRVQFKF
jgi:hypothetical protein